MDELTIVAAQLERMRGMTRYYHEQFFSDTRNVVIGVLALFVVGWAIAPQAFLLIPVLALIGANQTAFDASYLYFARHYASALERSINEELGARWLVGAELEDRYLFPLSVPKIVTIRVGSQFSWFGWMTVLFTLAGAVAFVAGLALGWSVLENAGTEWTVFYLVSLGSLTIASLATGYWWFAAGEGERRLREVLQGLGHPQEPGGNR